MTARSLKTWWWWTTMLLVAAITAFHYGTDTSTVVPHTIYRRLYYIPIVLAATAGGLRPGLITASLVAGLYFPHAFLMDHHMDPAPAADKLMELVLYVGVAGLAGLLVEREREARVREQRAAEERTTAEVAAQRLAGLVHLSRGLAHEIRNPLGGLQGAIEILAEDVPPTSPRRELVGVALRETERLNRVVSDFLEFARPRDPEPRAFDVGRTVDDAVTLLGPDAEKAGVRLVGSALAGLRGWADPQQIAQILLNLLRNAIQATPPGGEVRVSAHAEGDVVVEVTDTGPGVPSALAIYDPYVSGSGGTGLGLPISALLARQNGGSLGHRSSSAGATFRLTFPANLQGAP